MSKKKRSKILATLLCATTMAAFYASPRLVYAESLNVDNSGSVTTNTQGTKAISNLTGMASITFGVDGEEVTKSSVTLAFDVSKQGLYAKGAFTANDLYIMVDPKGEGTERYSLRNVMGIYRNQDEKTGEYATSIESGISGGGMQITNDTINMLDGTIAISTEKDAKYNISFDGKFNSEQGMTVGTDYTLDNRGNITTTGSISAKGTINGNEIAENTFNEVTLDGGEVTADEVTASSGGNTYKLTEVGSTLKTIDDKTKGIISYTSENGTTFQGKIIAYSGIVTSDVQTNTLSTTNIVSGNDSFTVHEAKEAIDWVDEWDSKVRDYGGRITQNETDIATLEKTVGDEREGLVKNVNDLSDTVSGHTTSISNLTGRVDTAETDIDKLQTTVGDESSGLVKNVNDLNTTVSGHTTSINDLTGRVGTAETDIDNLQATVGNESSGLVKNVNDLNTTVSGHTTSINDLTGRVGTAETDIDNLQATVGNESSGLVKNVNDLNTTVSGHTTSINDLTGRVGTAETDIDNLQATVGDENSGLVAKTKNLNADGSTLTGMDNITTNTFTATSGSIGSIGFSGNNLTNVASIGGVGNTVTVAGTAIGNGSFNSVSIRNFTSGTGATINGISIYQDSDGHYNVGTIDLNDLTGSGSSGTVDGIVRTDNTLQDKEDNDYTTTIEGNLEVRTNGTITQRNGVFAVAADGTVTGKDFAVKGTGTTLSGVASNVTALQTTVGNQSSGLVKNVNDLNTTVSGHTTSISDLSGRVGTAETDIDKLQTTVGDESSGLVKNVNDLNTTVSGHTTSINDLTGRVGTAETDIDKLQTTVGDESSGLVKKFNDLNTTVSGHTTSINDLSGRVGTAETNIGTLQTTVGDENSGLVQSVNTLNSKTVNLSADGSTLTGMTNITTNTFTATSGSIGSIGFSGNNLTNVASIGGVDNTVTVAGTAISNGSFNGVSIYKDANDYIVGDVNISALKGVSGTEIEGIKRTSNNGGGFTTTIEENLAVSTDGTIKQTNGDFAVDTDGNVTGKDFKVNGTSLGDVASAVNDQTKGLKATYDIASANQAAITDEETGLGALNNKTTGMTYTAGTTTADGITEFDHKLKATAFETENLTATEGNIGGISFETVNGVKTIGTDSDTITLAGNAISKGSFNGVSIGVDGSNRATFNGVSIYTDSANENDVMVGGINISALQSTTGTKLEGIVREPNEQGGGYTTTIEGSLAVNSATGNVTVDGEVTADDFRVGDTTFTNVASNVTNLNTVTTGMTYTPAGNDTQAVTSFDHKVQATNITTTAGADLNELSATVGDESSGLVQNVNTLNNKTTNLSADGSTLTDMTNIESAAGTIGGMTFATVNGMKTIGSADDTITVAGAEITSNSFNNVEIYQKDENSHYFVGDVDVSALKSGSAEITNKLRGITYSSPDPDDYTMTFAKHFSVSTDGEFTFKDGTGNEYHLGDLINNVNTGDFEELKDKVKNLEDKTTGISFDKDTGSTTISDMTGTDTDGDGINDSFTKGDNSLTVGDGGITANGDTVINGDTDDNTTGGNGNDSNDPQGGDSIINGDQLVDGDQHVTGDSQFDGTVTVGTGTDGNGQTVIDGGNITTGDTIIDGGSVTSKEGHFDNINVGSGENATTIGESGIQVGDNTTIDNSGVSIKDENGNVFMGDHDVVIKDSDGNVEASLSDVANRVDGIEQSIGDLNSRMGELEDRIDKVGAMAAAIANLRTMGYDPAAPTEVAVGIGQYRNETGAALGLFHYPNRDFMLSLSVSTSGDEVMGGIGATWKFGRKSPEKVAAEKAEKAREAKLQKAEAIKEAARLKKIEAQQERHAKLAAQKTATK